jgi:hypothetical protein
VYQDPRSGLKRQLAAIAAVFALGMLGGCLIARNRTQAPDAETTRMLVGVIQSLVHSQNAGPIVAAGIAAGAAILCAVLVPVMAVITLERVPKSELPRPHAHDELPGSGARRLPEVRKPDIHPSPHPRRR